MRKDAAGSAVQRNRMRRLVKEFFRINKNRFVLTADMVVEVKRYSDSTYKDIAPMLQALFIKSGLLK